MSHLVIWKILRLFVNTFTATDKYSLLNGNNLTQPLQMQLSGKQSVFFQFLLKVLKSRLNFEHFLKKANTPSYCIPGITDSEKRG